MSQSLAYDAPAYRVPQTVEFIAGTNPSGNVAQRQAVFTSMLAKSLTFSVGITGTNTSTVAVIRVSGTSTGTTTLGSYIIGTGVVTGTSIGTGVGQNAQLALANIPLFVGDQVAFLNGVDVSVGVAVTIEAYILPGANLANP